MRAASITSPGMKEISCCIVSLRRQARGVSFYRPDELPTEGQGKKLDKLIEIRRFHDYYSHPSIDEMKRMAELWFKDSGITHSDIEDWHDKEGKF